MLPKIHAFQIPHCQYEQLRHIKAQSFFIISTSQINATSIERAQHAASRLSTEIAHGFC